MAIIDSVVMELDQEAKTTRRLLERVPEDKLSWMPHPKSMSLGRLALHIAGSQGFLAGIAALDTFELGAIPEVEAKSRKEILDTFDQSVANAKQSLGKLTDAQLISTWTMTKGGKVLMSMPRIGFIRAIVMNHQIHHRGQLSVYLRMLDVPLPSIYGPSADENTFA